MSNGNSLSDRVRVEVLLCRTLIKFEGHVRTASRLNFALFFQTLNYVYLDQIHQFVLLEVLYVLLSMSWRELVVNVTIEVEWILFAMLFVFIFSKQFLRIAPKGSFETVRRTRILLKQHIEDCLSANQRLCVDLSLHETLPLIHIRILVVLVGVLAAHRKLLVVIDW